jgi:hypothetical protein
VTADDNQRELTPGEWNGLDYYAMFEDDVARSREDARSYGYVGVAEADSRASHCNVSSPKPACSPTTLTTDTSALADHLSPG